jgi:hypothetical protein
VTGRQTPTSAEPVSQALFPGLIDHVNEVRTVRIHAPQAILNVEAAGKGQWTLKERDGYPVEADKVRALVLAVANLQLVEAKTDKADRLKRLELEQPDGKDGGKSRLVELLDKDGKQLAAVVVGKARYGLYGGGRSGVYVRRGGEDQSWLAAGQIEVPAEPTEVLVREIVDIPATEVARVTLDPAGDAPPVVLQRPNASTPTFTTDAKLPEGRSLDPDRVESLAGALAGLTLLDVRQAATPPPAGGEISRTRFETFDGLRLDVTVTTTGAGDAAERWLQISAAAAPAAVAAPAPAGTPADPAAAAAPAAAAGSSLATPPPAPAVKKPAGELAKELNERLGRWSFKVSPEASGHLGERLDALLADKPAGAS